MKTLQEQLPTASVSFIIGAVVPALISLGIFATKADIAELKAWVASNYVSEAVTDRKLDKIEKALERLNEKIDRLTGK